jgi:hypothetical protein
MRFSLQGRAASPIKKVWNTFFSLVERDRLRKT